MIDTNTLAGFLSLGLGAISSYSVFAHFKSKVDAVKQLVDDADSDISKGSVSAADLQKIWSDLKAIVY